MKKSYRKRENHTDKKYDILKNRYIDAQQEYTYQTKLFYNRDITYSVYFALYIIAIAALYFLIFTEDSLEQLDILFITTEKVLASIIILFTGASYVFIISTYLDNFRKLIKSRHNVMLTSKDINNLLKEDVIKWEREFKSTYSLEYNRPNTCFIKMLYALILYCIIEISLIFLSFYIFKIHLFSVVFTVGITASSAVLLSCWYTLCYIFPKRYEKELYDSSDDLYK